VAKIAENYDHNIDPSVYLCNVVAFCEKKKLPINWKHFIARGKLENPSILIRSETSTRLSATWRAAPTTHPELSFVGITRA
jgi:hypothetical protein